MAEQLIDLAIVLFVFSAAWVLRRLTHTDVDTERWQQTARAAAAAETQRKHEIAELEAWLHAKPRPRNTIPHQTRRTEEP